MYWQNVYRGCRLSALPLGPIRAIIRGFARYQLSLDTASSVDISNIRRCDEDGS